MQSLDTQINVQKNPTLLTHVILDEFSTVYKLLSYYLHVECVKPLVEHFDIYYFVFFFQEFIQLYKIILPKGLLSSKEDVTTFLESMNLNKDNYQIGITKVK